MKVRVSALKEELCYWWSCLNSVPLRIMFQLFIEVFSIRRYPTQKEADIRIQYYRHVAGGYLNLPLCQNKSSTVCRTFGKKSIKYQKQHMNSLLVMKPNINRHSLTRTNCGLVCKPHKWCESSNPQNIQPMISRSRCAFQSLIVFAKNLCF